MIDNEKLYNLNIAEEFQIDLQLFAKSEDEGRTEEPSEYKKRKAREEGKVAKSQELISVMIMLFTFWVIGLFASYFYESFVEIIKTFVDSIDKVFLTRSSVIDLMYKMTYALGKIAVPILITSFVISLLANLIQTGFVFSPKAMQPKAEKISFTANKMFSKIFMSRQTLMNLFKSFFKVMVVGGIAALIISLNSTEFIRMTASPPEVSFGKITETAFLLVNAVGVFFIVLGIIDYIFQKREYIENLKMSKHEVKEERKETEGDPFIKQKLREKQRDLMSRRMMEEVPKADVVITNPTHYAIALKYDELSMDAPVVIAKGKGFIALKIIDIAKKNDIILYENKPLARGMFETVDIGEEVPTEFYEAIAEVIAFVYRIRNKTVRSS